MSESAYSAAGLTADREFAQPGPVPNTLGTVARVTPSVVAACLAERNWLVAINMLIDESRLTT